MIVFLITKLLQKANHLLTINKKWHVILVARKVPTAVK